MADAVVLVSGGAAVTPYTAPEHAAASGLAAGNTMTALRSSFLDRGVRVFTAPARIGPGQVRADAGWQGFDDVPVVLPAEVTINAVGRVDDAGAALAGFLRWLAAEEGSPMSTWSATRWAGCSPAPRSASSATVARAWSVS